MCRELTCSKRPFNPLYQFSTPGVRVLSTDDYTLGRKRLKVGHAERTLGVNGNMAHYALSKGVP